ncbi:hypothetical protein ACWOBP_01175 [Gemella parahaemolysans]
MKVSTAILLMLPCEILIFSSILLPSEYIEYAVAIIMFYLAGVLFVIAKYIIRGDNAHLISGISISYEEAKLPENIEKYAKDSKITGRILQIVSIICFVVGIYFVVTK